MTRLLNMLAGAGRVLDLSGSYRKRSHFSGQFQSPREADFHALRKDWERVGQDIRIAMDKMNSEHGEK